MPPVAARPKAEAVSALMKAICACSVLGLVLEYAQRVLVRIFDEYAAFYNLLMRRVGEMAVQGKSLDAIKRELKMPEYSDWRGQNNVPQKITVTHESVK